MTPPAPFPPSSTTKKSPSLCAPRPVVAMFLHSGASLHGHEYHTPHTQPRKRPFLRASLQRSNSSATVPDRYTTSSPPPTRPRPARRPVSETYSRPLLALLKDRSSTPTLVPSSPPVVRFKDIEVADEPAKSPMINEEDLSVYDSDGSHPSCSTPRRRKRRSAAPRKSTTFLVAVPPRLSGSKKTLFKTIRPRLLLQLQELAANHRSRPTIDVFPASLIAGPLATAPYINRFPRMFGVKGELGPRDLILVKSEDYTVDTDDEEEHARSSSRKHPVAVFSPGRGHAEVGEIVLDDGSTWVCSSSKAHYNFTHVDEHGQSLTVRWVKRSPPKGVLTGSMSPGIPQGLSSPPLGRTMDTVEPEYRYTFSIINPMTRRHPTLATLTPQSIEIYDEYTTPSSSSNRHPPTRQMSGTIDSTISSTKDIDLALSALPTNGSCAPRETLKVDEDTKKLIMITGLWLALRLGPTIDNNTDFSCDGGSGSQDTPRVTPSSTFQTLPRRQTTSFGSSTTPVPVPTTRIRRAMSTGASFMQRRKRTDSSQGIGSTATIVEVGQMSTMDLGSAQVLSAPVAVTPAVKQARRTSWFRKLTH